MAAPYVGVQVLAATLAPLLWATAAVAAIAGGAEIWRYLLLLRSRADALPAGVVGASDALVLAAGLVAVILVIGAGALVIRWMVRASAAAAARSQVSPARRPRAIVLGTLLPGPNLTVPGSVLAEIEHAALDRPPTERPRPSRLLLCWWALWIGNVMLAGITVAWALRTGVQARADGVVLHALLDLVCAATAVATALVVTQLTKLLLPTVPGKRMQVVRLVPATPGAAG